MRALVVDDEDAARILLKDLLEPYVHIVTVIGEAHCGTQALCLIERQKPDLLFLDIEMPDINGFDLLSRLSYQPLVVFTTAYEQYAISAFKENSIDYLLKPIEEERMKQCIQKLDRLKSPFVPLDYHALYQAFLSMKSPAKATAIPIKAGQKIRLVRYNEITYAKASGGYVSLFTTSGKEYICDYSLSELETKLPEQFLRVQKSFIVNIDRIDEIHKYFNNRLILIMNDKKNSKITTGTSYIQQIRNVLDLE